MHKLSDIVFIVLMALLGNVDEGERRKELWSIDRKTMRGNGNKNQKTLHVVSAWSKKRGVCLGQKSADSKGKEIPMILNVWDVLSVRNQMVTIDAIGIQTELAAKIQAGKGDYLLEVKGNQQGLHENILLYFNEPTFLNKAKVEGGYVRTSEKAYGRIETREYYQAEDIGWLPDKERWAGIKSIGVGKITIRCEQGSSVDLRYYISSLRGNSELLCLAVRGYWSVESIVVCSGVIK